jgi:hypothetical protein
VEEDYRKAMIKYETTITAADDLKKYYTAIDKVSDIPGDFVRG